VIVYVNGDSHSAGAEAVNPYCFAQDDPLYWGLGRQPHPDNERVSYGCHIANYLGAILYCDAESASSNARIIRTTREYLETNTPNLVIIGWSTWEREEWLHNGQYWQINAGGVGNDWPEEFKQAYPNWIIEKNYNVAMDHEHTRINNLHLDLVARKIPHLFFNTFAPFSNVHQLDWHDCYLYPYSDEFTYYNWCKQQGFKTVTPSSYHFGPDAHEAWSLFLFRTYSHSMLTAK